MMRRKLSQVSPSSRKAQCRESPQQDRGSSKEAISVNNEQIHTSDNIWSVEDHRDSRQEAKLQKSRGNSNQDLQMAMSRHSERKSLRLPPDDRT